MATSRKPLNDRVNDLETGQGRLLREVSIVTNHQKQLGTEVGNLGKRVETLEHDGDRPSQTNISLHPNRAKVILHNVSPWAAVAIVALLVLLAWIVFRR